MAPRQGERRHITVLFSDLVGSTRLSSEVDPEDLRAVIRSYQQGCAAVVTRFDGVVAQYLGDGILAYFGYPKAHEDDAERAVRAGLGIVDAVNRLGSPIPGASTIRLAVRVGIATGLVVAGDPLGTKPGEDSAVVGETPNLAARLQDLARLNTVVIAPETRRLLADRFLYEDLGRHALKGFPAPVHAWRVVQPNDGLSRFEAAHRADLTPLVGRDEELDVLMRRWTQARASRGQVVLLSGEPGIGKSRICEALCGQIPHESRLLLRFQCSPHYASTALYPVVTWLERLLGSHRGNSTARRLEKLEALLRGGQQPIEPTGPLLAALLSLPTGDRYAPLDMSPQRQRERTLAALTSLLEGFAIQRCVVVVFEDAHWIDPTSQELLDLLVERASRMCLLMLITFRPGYAPPWTGLPHVTLRVLQRLNPGEATEMARRVACFKALPSEVNDQIIIKTDGVPLFIEELTKTILESGLVKERGDRYVLDRTLPSLAIPATLRDSLMARLDQQTSVREVAQVASAIGRQFSYDLLAAVAALPEAELRAALDQLASAELVFRHGMPPHATYAFKHALVQDAAYESLLLTRRRTLHARIVEVLEAQFPDTAAARSELLAHHASEARLSEKAVRYWHAAGQAASDRSANLEAISHLTTGLDLVASLPETPERYEQELRLLIALGPVLINVKGPRTREVAQNYARAAELCATLPESPLHFAALWGSWRISDHFQIKHERAARLLALAERLGDPGLRLQAHHCLWASLFHLGQHEACCEHVAQGLALYEAGDYRTHGSLYGGHDPKVCAVGERAFSLWLLGFPDQSLSASHQAMDWARCLGHAGTLVHALDMSLLLHRYRREAETVKARAEELIRYAGDHGLPVHQAKGRVFLGWALAQLGQPELGIELMRQGLETQQAIGTREDFPILFDMLAVAYAAVGEAEQGLTVLDEALAETEQSGLSYWTAELYRSRGVVLRALTPAPEDEAESWFRRALALAREQGARALELRVCVSLARLEQQRGQTGSAYQRLAQVYGWFLEGFDTVDLCEARAMLDELAPSVTGTAHDPLPELRRTAEP